MITKTKLQKVIPSICRHQGRNGLLRASLLAICLSNLTSTAMGISTVEIRAFAYAQGRTPGIPANEFNGIVQGAASQENPGNTGFNNDYVGPVSAFGSVNTTTGTFKLSGSTSGANIPDQQARNYLRSYAFVDAQFFETIFFSASVKSLVKVIFDYHAVMTQPVFENVSPDTLNEFGVEMELYNQAENFYSNTFDSARQVPGVSPLEVDGQLELAFFVGPGEVNEYTLNPKFWIRTGTSPGATEIDALSTGTISIELPESVTFESESGVFLSQSGPKQVPDSPASLMLPLALAILIRKVCGFRDSIRRDCNS